MTDLRKTKLFRWGVFLVLFPAALVTLAVADEMIIRTWDYCFGAHSGPRYAIEIFTFIYLMTGRIWAWLDRRVWIGTEESQRAN